MKKANKSTLKEKNSYYYESTPVFDSLPEELSVPEYKIEIFDTYITHKEILEKYSIKPYTLEQAAAVTCDIIPSLEKGYKARIVYFEKDGTLYRFGAWRDGDGQLGLSVREVRLDVRYDPVGAGCASATET